MLLNTIRYLLIASLISFSAFAKADFMIVAAASLTNALGDISKAYQAKTGVKITTSFAASSALAKQVENGLPADIFISADSKWMDYLYDKGKVDGTSRKEFLGNTLVLIAPKGQSFRANLVKGGQLANAFEGKLCTGETETVPAGKYAKEALQKLGLWDGIKSRVVGTEDVRAALAFVERGECAAGIVYETDARISKKVDVIGTFPEDSHAPIVYPMAMLSQSEEAKAFLEYLNQADAAKIFAEYGFKRLQP
ncbi:molybdate ABC transporter substrate-binding protein [Methylosoma difficile]